MSTKPSDAKWHSSDPSSFSRPDQVSVSSVHLNWTVDFDRQVIRGAAELTCRRHDSTATHLILDTRSLHIDQVKDLNSGQSLTFSHAADESHPLGTPLSIELAADCGPCPRVLVRYSTGAGSECTALAWLSAEQTAGHQEPFVFSQCQAVHCRSLLPCQDTPAVKFSYTARVRVPAGLTALMSALARNSVPGGSGAEDSASGGGGGKPEVVFCFEQPVAVPAYLVAVAVGRLQRRELSERCAVWAEPETVTAAAAEFVDTERMLESAERLCGEYVWQRYDLLVLPPSFPYGGMENPCLTFLTPTLLAGDRSLASVVAHEISHSWTGNLVTNRNWEHFWLNEGFTTFLERKIVGRLKSETERHLSATVGWRSLRETVDKLKAGKEAGYTCLVPRLDHVDPDDAFSCVPYEKGHTFLWYLEELVGGADVFEPFLRAYIDKHKYKTVDSDVFRQFLLEYFGTDCRGDDGVLAKLESVDWDTWLCGEGMPPYTPHFDTSLTDACSQLCARWAAWNVAEPCPLSADDISAYSPGQLIELFGQMLELNPALSCDKLMAMQRLYGMQTRNNAEIRFRWLRLCVRARRDDMIDECLRFVSEQGRMKYTRPLYRDLGAWPEAKSRAVVNFNATKSSMMHVAVVAIAKDLGISA